MTVFPDDMTERAAALLQRCREAGLILATAESCTGGLIAGLLTEIAGSSDVVDRGFVTYSNAAKTQMLGVDAAMIKAQGAVSANVAEAMALGVLDHAPVDLAVAVTGVAGPGGGSAEKPVGLVYLCAARRGEADDLTLLHSDCLTLGDSGRGPIRLATVDRALALLDALI